MMICSRWITMNEFSMICIIFYRIEEKMWFFGGCRLLYGFEFTFVFLYYKMEDICALLIKIESTFFERISLKTGHFYQFLILLYVNIKFLAGLSFFANIFYDSIQTYPLVSMIENWCNKKIRYLILTKLTRMAQVG